jgi:hypothetical protein
MLKKGVFGCRYGGWKNTPARTYLGRGCSRQVAVEAVGPATLSQSVHPGSKSSNFTLYTLHINKVDNTDCLPI